MGSDGLVCSQSLPKSDFWVSFFELLVCFLEVFSDACLNLFLVSVLGCFFMILGLLLGPSWGTLGGKSGHFGTPFWRFPKRTPLWCHFGPFWEDLGALWEHFGRIWGSFWEVFGVVAGSLQTPWQTPWPANLHQKTFVAPNLPGTGRNVAAAT